MEWTETKAAMAKLATDYDKSGRPDRKAEEHQAAQKTGQRHRPPKLARLRVFEHIAKLPDLLGKR
jgi:hypothetical protein